MSLRRTMKNPAPGGDAHCLRHVTHVQQRLPS